MCVELGSFGFDVVVIDGAAQCTEISAWQSMLKAPKVVLAGDREQLTATVPSAEAKRLGVEQSVLERLQKLMAAKENRQVSCKLTTQYRMCAAVMEFPNNNVYG